MIDVGGFLAMRPKWQVLFLCTFLVAALGGIDCLTGEYSLTIFYLLPVFISTWFVSSRAGFAFCLTSAAVITAVRHLPPITLFNPAAMKAWNTTMEVFFLAVITYMISQLKKELDIEKELARTDYLTGALNRRSFVELAEYEINQSRRHLRPMTIAYVDLDNFKAVNDQQGHHAGDTLLCKVVSVLEENCRSTDLVARLGGDEFGILYPETAGEAAAPLLARLHDRLTDAMAINGWPVTVSIGAITYLSPPASAAAMLREADARMYTVKEMGKNRVSHATIETRSVGELRGGR